MKNLFFLILIILLGCNTRQNISNKKDTDFINTKPYSPNKKLDQQKPLPYSPAPNNYYDKEFISRYSSPSGKYEMKIIFKSMSDNNKSCNYWLIFKDATPYDSLELQTAVVHDINPPVYYWNEEMNQLVYEYGGEEPRRICVFDLSTKKLFKECPGFIDTPDSYAKQNYDSINKVLLFFRKPFTARHGFFHAKRLELKTLEVTLLDSILTSGDPYTGSPFVVRSDFKKGQAVIFFENPLLLGDSLIVNYN